MPNDTEVAEAPKAARKPRAKNGTRKPRAPKGGRFVATIEVETTSAGLADVSQMVESLNSEGTTARLSGVREK